MRPRNVTSSSLRLTAARPRRAMGGNRAGLRSEQNELVAAPNPASAATLGWRLSTEERRCVDATRISDSLLRDRPRIGSRRGIERVLHRVSSQPDELARRLEFAILSAQPFELETKGLARHRPEA